MDQSESRAQKPIVGPKEDIQFVSVDALKTLFNPRSIALVGASGSISPFYTMTSAPLAYLINYDYQGKIFPVNPKYQEIKGIKCYPSLSAIPEEIDVVLVLTPAKDVPKILEESGRKGVKGIIVISAGFAETGEEGRIRQQQLKVLAEHYGFLLLGPNCNGLVNGVKGIPISFAVFLDGEKLRPGKIGFVSQTGALLSGIVSRAKEWGIGFSYLVGTGNEAHLDLADFLRFMVEDPWTEVIMALIEGVKDTKKFCAVAELALERGKPIIALKLGASESGVRSATSHTGNIAGSFPVYMGAFRQKGIIATRDVNDFLLTARTLLQTPVPKGEGIGVVTTSGGGAGLLSDLIHQEGFRLGNLSARSVQNLSSFIPWYSTAKNPFDFTAQFIGDPSFASKVYEVFLQDSDIHILLLNIMPVPHHERKLINDLVEVGKRLKKPVAVLYIGGRPDQETEELINQENLPFFSSPLECVKTLGNLLRYNRYLKRVQDYGHLEFPRGNGKKALDLLKRRGTWITEIDRRKILSFYGIRSVKEKLATSLPEALSIADSFGYPVVLKAECHGLLHKTEVMGVELNIYKRSDLKQAYRRILKHFREALPNLRIEGVLVQEMVTDHVAEVIVGVTQDPQFGPTIMFGLGGTMVEAIHDVSFRICPLSTIDAKEMIEEVKGYRILTGFRGKPKGDIPALQKAVLGLSILATDLSESIREIEINPLMVYPEKKGVKAADTVFIFHRERNKNFRRVGSQKNN
jgi:acyl-CoA synthetase (NDP forming)